MNNNGQNNGYNNTNINSNNRANYGYNYHNPNEVYERQNVTYVNNNMPLSYHIKRFLIGLILIMLLIFLKRMKVEYIILHLVIKY